MHESPPRHGRGLVHLPDGRGGWRPAASAPNGWDYTWGDVVARMCLPDGPLDYRPAYIYLEFRNDGAAPATVPEPPRSEGVGHFLGLEATPDRDYLRIPIVERTPGRDPAYEGTASLPPGAANMMTFSGVSAATQGVLGRPFTAAAGSLVYASALVAAPFPDDPTRDVVWARAVYPPADQFTPVAASSSVRATHILYFR